MNWSERIGSSDLSEATNAHNVKQPCYERCDIQKNNVELSALAFPNESQFKTHKFFCVILQKLIIMCNDKYKSFIFDKAFKTKQNFTCKELEKDDLYTTVCPDGYSPTRNETIELKYQKVYDFIPYYTKNNVASLMVYFKDNFYTLYERNEAMSLLSFLGNTGGLLGLCMGLSVVSLFEIFFHLLNFFGK